MSWRAARADRARALAHGICGRAPSQFFVGLYALDHIGRLAGAGLLGVVIAFGLAFYLSCLWLFGILRAERRCRMA